jgi:NADH-quinone oxidoreductase subunit C
LSSEVEAAGAPPEETPVPPGAAQRVLLDELTAELGDRLVGSHIAHDDLWVRVDRGAWRAAAEACRRLGFDYFCFLSGLDWMPHTWPNPKVEATNGAGEAAGDEEAEPEPEPPEPEPEPGAASESGGGGWQTGYAGGDTRFQVFARLYSTTRHLGVTLKADLDDERPAVETWSTVYPGADWHERETWEMYGFEFVGHPKLAHIYLPGEFEGFPLRKDFPLLSREVKPWPGLVDVEPFPPGTDDDAAPAEEAAG